MSSTINASTASGGGVITTADASGILQLQTTGVTALTIDASQNVTLNNVIPSGSTAPVNGMFLPAASTIGFSTASSERMRIDSSGNVLVGGTTQWRPTKFTVKGEDDNQFYLDNDGSQHTSMYMLNNGVLKTSFYWNNTNARTYIQSVSAGVYLASGATSWTANSDERKKDIIEPIIDAVNKVSKLRAVIGKYKTDEEGIRRSFLIAQDVLAVFPEAVDFVNPDDLGVQYTEVIPLLVASIKELKAIIDTQNARIEALEAK
jgi:hypothetical protein